MKTAVFMIFRVLLNCFSSSIFGMSWRLNNFPSHCLLWDFWTSMWPDSRKCLPNVAPTAAAFLNTCVHFCLDLFFIHSLITRMLQRDPKRRASLEEIENHAWLQGVDPSPATKYNIPLVSYKNLSEEEHNSIIQRMVLGDIADRDTIVE